MTVQMDPEGHELEALYALAQVEGARVFEVGCGDGRFTWCYAEKAAQVVALDPDQEDIAIARRELPARLHGRVELVACDSEAYLPSPASSNFDLVIFAWSL